MKILVREVYEGTSDCDYSNAFVHQAIYETAILEQLDEYVFSYIEHIVKSAVKGDSCISSSRKYSFSDCPEWYQSAEVDAVIFDAKITVELG